MFKKDLTPGPRSKLKSSAQRAVRARIVETYPQLAPHIDSIVPKKEQLDVVKLCTLYILPPSTPLFWQHMDDPPVPHLKLVHQHPTLFPRVRVDRGAIRFVLGGATLMVPGFTSKGGRLPQDGKDGKNQDEEEGHVSDQQDMEAGAPVVVEAEGMQHACAVGLLKVGTEVMRKEKKGVGIEGAHFLGDGLWKLTLE